MIQFTRKELERKIGFKLKNSIISFGFDPASKTGWSIITIDNNNLVTINYGTIHIESNDIYFKYDTFIENFKNLIKETVDNNKTNIPIVAIIEDCWLGKNVNALKMLARISAICYTMCYLANIDKKIISPLESRKALGFNGKVKKKEFQKAVLEKYKFDLTDEDAIDAIVLALNGAIIKKELF